MDKIMTLENVSKTAYNTILDLYNAGGCESVREYIDNNDIDSTEYNNALKKMLDDDNTDKLFELMITHEKFKHTAVIDEFISDCNSKFKLDLVWKVKELDFHKTEMELKQYQEEIKLELSESELAQLELGQLKLCRSKLSERGKELESKIYLAERHLSRYVDSILTTGCKNALIKILEYKPTLFKSVNFSEFFMWFDKINYHVADDKCDFLNYILSNENTKKVVTENFIKFVDSFTRKEYLSFNMEEKDFKKVLDVISKSVSEDQFQFLLEYLIKELVYAYRVMGSLYDVFELEYIHEITYRNHYNIIELLKYIHNLYGDKFKISFNIDYEGNYHNQIREKHTYNNMIYDQMIFNGYEFLSTFASIFYEDLFFPKKDLINHIVKKNRSYQHKIEEGDLDRNDVIFFVEYKKTLNLLVSNINTITKKIDPKQLKYLQDIIDDVNIIYDELVKKCPENMTKFLI
jgi:Trp operon repressor